MRLGGPTALAGAGYFFVWAVCGMAVYLPGAALASYAMGYPAMARVVPFMAGAVVLLAGTFQFSAWKARQLACCRKAPGTPQVGIGQAWRHGVHLGLGCLRCCGNLMAVGLVTGVMDLRVMAALTAAIAIERRARAGKATARAIGALAIGAGCWLIARAAGRA
jgi:predicted metal-binding membrane protein